MVVIDATWNWMPMNPSGGANSSPRVKALNQSSPSNQYIRMVSNQSKSARDHHTEWLVRYSHKFSSRYLRRFDEVWPWLDLYAPELQLTALNGVWMQKYANWLLQTENPYTGEMPHDGTVGRHMEFFRTMLKFARLPHDWLKGVPVAEMPVVALSYPEMLAIYDAVYPTDELRQTADQFLLLSQLGMHYTDWLRLCKEHVEVMIFNDKAQFVLFRHQQAKSSAQLNVGLPHISEIIWKQYGGHFEKVPKQQFNARLKVVGFVAGLSREVTLPMEASQDGPIASRPLWQLLTARTARHTCASLLIEGRRMGETIHPSPARANRTRSDPTRPKPSTRAPAAR